MDGEWLLQMRDELLNRRERIGIGAANVAAGNSDLLEAQAEMIDIAQAIEQLDRDSSLAEQERRELVAIERALAKLSLGHFGVCEDCEEEIPKKRLFALPSARLCAACQAIEERQAMRSRAVSGAAFR